MVRLHKTYARILKDNSILLLFHLIEIAITGVTRKRQRDIYPPRSDVKFITEMFKVKREKCSDRRASSLGGEFGKS